MALDFLLHIFPLLRVFDFVVSLVHISMQVKEYHILDISSHFLIGGYAMVCIL